MRLVRGGSGSIEINSFDSSTPIELFVWKVARSTRFSDRDAKINSRHQYRSRPGNSRPFSTNSPRAGLRIDQIPSQDYHG